MAHPNTGTKAVVPKPSDQRVFRSDSLLEWIFDVVPLPEAVCGHPAAVLDVDPATLDLKDNQAFAWMEDNKVGLSITLTTSALGLPADVMQYDPSVR